MILKHNYKLQHIQSNLLPLYIIIFDVKPRLFYQAAAIFSLITTLPPFIFASAASLRVPRNEIFNPFTSVYAYRPTLAASNSIPDFCAPIIAPTLINTVSPLEQG